MGATQSSITEKITDEMINYHTKWQEFHGTRSQTEVFRENVPSEKVNFTEPFNRLNLNEFFTGGVVLPIVGEAPNEFNCLHLFRSSQEKQFVPLYNNDQFTLLHPLGEPGRDLPDNHGSKVSHMMVVKHGGGTITFNERLPSNHDETEDFVTRIAFGEAGVQALRRNDPVENCGDKVLEKADELGIDHQTGIREYMATVIASFTDDFKYGQKPGYLLKDESNNEISGDKEKVQAMINTVFTNESLNPFSCIQPPWKNTQVFTHIHIFLLENVPEEIQEIYYDCKTILEVKKKLLQELDEGEEEGDSLSRQSTVCDGPALFRTTSAR